MRRNGGTPNSIDWAKMVHQVQQLEKRVLELEALNKKRRRMEQQTARELPCKDARALYDIIG